MRTRRSVSRDSYSFIHFPRALHNCALRISDDDPYDAGLSAFVIEEQPLGSPVQFGLELRVELEALASQAAIPPDKLSLTLLVKSQELKRDVVLESWGHTEVPREWQGAVPPDLFGQRRVTVSLVCHLNATLDRSLSRPWRNGSVLAERHFTISLPTHASLFQVGWESFAALGWEPEALWKVDFRITEGFHEVEPEDALAIYANKDLPAFHRLLAPGAARNPRLSVTSKILLRTVGAMIAADVATPVLADLHTQVEDGHLLLDDVDEDSLSGQVLELISQMELDPVDAIRIAVEEPHRIRHQIQGLLGVGSTLDQRALDRILAP